MNYKDCESGQQLSLPALYTESGILISHIRYLAWFCNKSESWRERAIFSLKLLIEYINSVPDFSKATQLLKSFTQALVAGTIDYRTLDDSLGLFWKPRKISDANNILFHITNYTDFLVQQDDYKSTLVNPFRKASSYEERLNWCAYYNKQANVFLNHLSDYKNVKQFSEQVRMVGSIPDNKVDVEKALRFPESQIERLLYLGYLKKDSQPDFKLQAMTMLMNYGGIRKSELFHIYISDITQHPDRPDEALVRVYHPEFGQSPSSGFKTRSEYLETLTKYKSRTKYRFSERLYAGWKNPLLTSKLGYYEVLFCPPDKAKDFLMTWVNYLKYQRIEPPENNFHPFAFTNNEGAPETIKNFQRMHKNAIEKIGLSFCKAHGTTEHGHRHAYGYRLREFGLDQIDIQKSLHHKSPLSPLVYIKPTIEEVRSKMKETE